MQFERVKKGFKNVILTCDLETRLVQDLNTCYPMLSFCSSVLLVYWRLLFVGQFCGNVAYMEI